MNTMNRVFDVAVIFGSIMNILLNSLGCFLLIRLYKNGKQTLQQFYLIHFGFCHVLINVIQFLRCTADAIPFTSFVMESKKYLDLLNHAGSGIIYYCGITYITLDRLLDIVLNIRYPIYWSEKEARYLVLFTWVLGVGVTVMLSLLHRLRNTDFYYLLFTFICPTLNSMYLFLAVTTYSFIFHRFRRTRCLPSTRTKVRETQRNSFVMETLMSLRKVKKVYQDSTFHIPVLIITSFIILKVIPDLIAQIIGCGHRSHMEIPLHVCMISNCISGSCSAYIYVFIQPSVKKLLVKIAQQLRMRLRRWRGSDGNGLHVACKTHPYKLIFRRRSALSGTSIRSRLYSCTETSRIPKMSTEVGSSLVEECLLNEVQRCTASLVLGCGSSGSVLHG